MVLEFDRDYCSCLHNIVNQVHSQEETQELRLPDGMPDIGKVVGCWGQILIRGKEWRTNHMSTNGGVMVWVMYTPEDGTDCRCIESWIPFQMHWDVPDTRRDGIICVNPILKSVDARSVSARKLMLRCVVCTQGQAFEPVDEELYIPTSVPEDVQLLRRNYPVELPLEAGEKSFQIEDTIRPVNFDSVVRYELTPQITEQKVMASRLVFRGTAKLHLLYKDVQNNMLTMDSDLQFAQYADLDREYGSGATAWLIPIVNGVEVEKADGGGVFVRCAITAQYVIHDRKMIEIIEDAYSTRRQVMPQVETLSLPMQLDAQQWLVECPQQIQIDGNEIVDAAAFYDHPSCKQNGDSVQMDMDVQYQLLCRDNEGNLMTHTAKSQCSWQMQSDEKNDLRVCLQMIGQPRINLNGGIAEIQPNAAATVAAYPIGGIPMVKGLTMTEEATIHSGGPSVILRRVEEQSMWEIAKECHTTVEAIRSANQLEDDPLNGQMLLIPLS